ncbi:DUF982 domain-containing protein [Roseibium sp.]|uniref:DUF982 domain-containing protein n=1 Tax=Roseibium sp. TaxID=1936156 RepID=UPI003A97979D
MIGMEETLMYHFEKPVSLLIGIGFPARIETVLQANAFLEDWPCSQRDGSHKIASAACKAFLAGEVEAETVRSLFTEFARRHDLLIVDPEVPTDRGNSNHSLQY